MSSSIASLLFGFGVMTSYVHGQSSTAASFTVKPGFEVQAVCPGLSRDALDSAFDFSALIPSQMALNAEGDKLYLLYTEAGGTSTQLHVRDLNECSQELLTDEIKGGVGLALLNDEIYISHLYEINSNARSAISKFDLNGELIEANWVEGFGVTEQNDCGINFLTFDEASNLYATTTLNVHENIVDLDSDLLYVGGNVYQISSDAEIKVFSTNLKHSVETCISFSDPDTGEAKELIGGNVNSQDEGEILYIEQGFDFDQEAEEGMRPIHSLDSSQPAGITCTSADALWELETQVDVDDEDAGSPQMPSVHPSFVQYSNAQRIDMLYGNRKNIRLEGVVSWEGSPFVGYDVVDAGNNQVIFDVNYELFKLVPRLAYHDVEVGLSSYYSNFPLKDDYAFKCEVSGSVYVPDPSPMCSDYIYGLYHHYDDIFARQQLPYRAKYSSYTPCYHGYFPEVKVDVNGFIQGQFKFTSPFTCAQESVYANLGNVGPIFYDSFVLSLEALKFRSDLCFYLPFLYKGSTWLFWKPTEIKSFSLKNSPQENAIIEGILAQQTKYGILANIQVESQDKFYYTTIGSLTFQCEATRQNLEVTSSQSDQWGQDQWQQEDKWNSWNQGNDHDWKEDSWTRRAKYPKARSRSRPRWAH